MNEELTLNEKIALLAATDRDKFAAKLTYEQRCEILALYRTGVTREALADLYKVDRRTVGFIYRNNSPHYRAVREEERDLGLQKFREKYLTEEVVNKALAYRQAKAATTTVKSNKQASKRAGLHVVRGTECTYEHRVSIAWQEQNDSIPIAGWYYRDLDGDFPDIWLSADEESLKTSDSCYKAMLGAIFDPMVRNGD